MSSECQIMRIGMQLLAMAKIGLARKFDLCGLNEKNTSHHHFFSAFTRG
jgi:hypothetical protein